MCPNCQKEPKLENQPYCRDCKREYDRRYYSANKETMKLQRKVTRKAVRIQKERWVFSYLQKHPCVDCGNNDPVVLEFDHVHPESKKKEVSELLRGDYSLDTLKEEVKKCVIRCANCHTKRTAHQFNWWITKYEA